MAKSNPEINTVYNQVMKYAEGKKNEIQESSPDDVKIMRIYRSISYLLQENSKLLECSPASIFMCASSSAMMGLELSKDIGEAYLVPYGKVCKLMPSYKGLIKLALRHPDIKGISCSLVYENDKYEFSGGSDRYLIHKFDPFKADRGLLIGVYASYETASGFFDFEALNMEEVNKCRKVSKGGNIWNDWHEEMVKKTALRRLCKRIPKLIDLNKALDFDMNIETKKPQDHGENFDDMKDVTPEEEQPENRTDEETASGLLTEQVRNS